MAEEIDLNADNLCTTEDAFEKFQAISMYEENEFITLGDIAPQQLETPNLTSMQDEIKYDNEVILKSPLEEQVFEVNSTIECGSEENQPEEAPSQVDLAKEPHQEAPSESQVRKRGRKKKNQQSILIPSTAATRIKQNNVAPTSTPNSQPTSSTPTPKRRGRKPKRINDTVNDNHKNLSNDNVDSNSTSTTPIKPQCDDEPAPLKTQSPNVSLNYNCSVENSPKRPGRKKKQPNLEMTNDNISEVKECSDNITNVKMTKGEQSKGDQELDQTNNDIEIITTDLVPSPNQSLQHNDTIPSIVDKEIPKRRRSTKPSLEEKLQSHEKTVFNDTTDDETDDICLSKLKLSLDPKDTVQNDNIVGENSEAIIIKTEHDNIVGENSGPIIMKMEHDNIVGDNSEAIIIKMEETKIESIEDSCTAEEPTKRMAKKPNMTDFEYNIDNIDTVCNEKEKALIDDQSEKIEDSLLVEDTSKRPVRRKVKQTMHYEEESDDPYANMESSDDEPPKRGKKGSKYYSDDEYVPGALKRGNVSSSDLSDMDDEVDELIKQRRKKKRTDSSLDKTPKKRGRKPKYFKETVKSRFSPEVQTIEPNAGTEQTNDVEVCLQSSLIKTNEDSNKKLGWEAATSEFTNFIAKKIQGTDIKITKATSVQPIEIPVIDPNLAKKTVEACAQTTSIKTTSVEVQTSPPHDIAMKDNVGLTAEQTDKACEFLKGIVKTTAELGELMTQKSEDFIKKKINSSHVTDTFKMDYCVRKSFLLFKLAKHNLMQMEEDLAKQYDEFLNSNNLSQYREKPKLILATEKAKESDSDCEIIEGPVIQKTKPEKVKPKFNPKTVFLNKELSIKIAKKPCKEKKLNVKNPHTVWINDSVMVKKVKPTQSFLAQDSRNKKPPDCVTIEMVNEFFKEYYRQQALVTCAPFLSTEWLLFNKKYQCSYFLTKPDDFANSSLSHEIPSSSGLLVNTVSIVSEGKGVNCDPPHGTPVSNPKPLFSLCVQILSKHLCSNRPSQRTTKCKINGYTFSPQSLHCLCINNINSNINKSDSILILKTGQHPLPLKTLCLKTINNLLPDTTAYVSKPQTEIYLDRHLERKQINEFEDLNGADSSFSKMESGRKTVNSLFSLCVQFIQSKLEPIQIENCIIDKELYKMTEKVLCQTPNTLKNINSVRLIQSKLRPIQIENFIIDKKSCKVTENLVCHTPKTLKNIMLKNINYLIFDDQNEIIEESKQIDEGKIVKSLSNLCFEIISKYFANCDVESSKECLTINSVNTLTEEAYLNIEPSHDTPGDLEYYADDDNDFYEDETEDFTHYDEVSHTEENNWISQVQNELKSCFVGKNLEASEVASEEESMVTKIKIEPEDDNILDTSIVKTEPMSNLDEMTIFPDNVITKAEAIDHNVSGDVIHRKDKSYDVETFETFVTSNKMMHDLNECHDADDFFSHGSSRIRRQYEPDSDPEYDMDMSLLVPQTYEPMHIENAKDSLMQSSGDESGAVKKSTVKKKPEKRKTKSKKNDSKTDRLANEKTDKHTNEKTDKYTNEKIDKHTNEKTDKHINEKNDKYINEKTDKHANEKTDKNTNDKTDKHTNVKTVAQVNTKEIPKTLPTNEVTILTRRMREKIRQEEKKVASSDSESEELPMILQKDKENNIVLPKKLIEKTKQTNKTKSKGKNNDDAIQCNNVDSTEQINESSKMCESPDPTCEMFTGFTSVDQSDISNYQKYLKYLSDKINSTPPSLDNNELEIETVSAKPIINPDEPVELLECEPTFPIQDDVESVEKPKNKSDLKNKEYSPITEQVNIINEVTKPYVDRNGWSCYPLDINDTKLYQDAQILLEKLPESFVDIYFKYQSIADKDEVDEEVERLTNLQSLNRSVKEGKIKSIGKSKVNISQDQDTSNQSAHPDTISRIPSPTYSEGYNELTPSEDEGDNADEETPSVPKGNVSENNMAKNSLMDDHESEDESGNKVKIKTEPPDNSYEAPPKKCRPCPKSKKKIYEQLAVDSESLMLTADKMMNKELNLLHAPVVLDEGSSKTPVKGPVTRNKTKTSTKNNSETKHLKTEEDSSSEEEKQWFTIKEKLLKRMINKKDSIREDDAKRAKLVNEYIERREEQTENYLKRRKLRGRRSTKKMLERQKQLKVLSRELFGDPANDPTLQGKSRYSQTSNFKGRRNIRKVIDKKSLAKSTVVANMEEFERKRRLNIRHNKLREMLRCEEGVNVLVINDEVCLEYDFAECRPVVTIHSFFTKVMKAHQYEGVKFMWDACFESLERVESGDGGGGCILAHCMGLGKTLQVLALLHTVLTHPRVNMQRVLVCCPLSTVLNWVDEIHKWIGPVTGKIKVFELSKLKKTYERAYQLEDWYNGGGIFIIGYELFRSLTTLDPDLDDVRPTIINKIRTALLDPGPDIIICDEGHLLKNDCSVLAVAMSRVVTKRRIVLTGTPMQNNLREYYCMVNFIKPNLLGTYAEYSNRFENPIMNGQHRDSREEDIKLMKARTHILHKVLEGCLQRQEASVLYPYLPKKHEYTVFVSLTKCQWDLYKHYMENYANSQSKSVLKDFHILQKIWSHPQVLHNFQTRTSDCTKNKVKIEKLEDDLAREDLNADLNPPDDLKPGDREVWWLQYLEGGAMLNSLHSSNKFVAVFRILDECIALGDKLLIFSTSLFTMDSLEYFLKENNKWSLGREYYRLDGSVPAEVRQKWCREFNAENNHKTKLFLISTRAGSLGLNMTAANRVIILDTSWNPAHDIQSIFRVYRFGQKKDCYIYRLVALGTMEQKIYERSVTKQAVACRVLDEQQIDRHYNMADLTELYRYDESGVSVAGGVAVGVCDVALLRVARDANLHAVHEHDSLLRGSAEQGLPEHERNAAWMQFQQEHAHKQMQNDLETEYEKAKQSIKHVHGHSYSLSPNLNPIIKTEKDEEFVPGKTETKSRRNKKNSIVSCCIPIQPESSSVPITPALPPQQEEAIVKQIAAILLKHNFKKRSGPKEISALVANVQRIVESGQIAALADEDDLTKSIAKVLLQRALPMPALTDIVCESVNNTIKSMNTSEEQSTSKVDDTDTKHTKTVRKSKRKCKKGYVYEEIVPEKTNSEISTDGKRKRRAALEAEKSFDVISDDIIDLDNDRNDCDFVPDKLPDTQSKIKTELKECDTKNVTSEAVLDVATKKTKTTKNVVYTDIQIQEPEIDTILLSDEESPKPKRPGPARKTMPAVAKNKKQKESTEKKTERKPEDTPTEKPLKKAKVIPAEKLAENPADELAEKPAEEPSENPEEIVPLPPSLLQNQNFIKIVAHTYLNSHPILDEDAAMLAALYSTQKALKDYETTGKSIVSGPLHDIAKKVLGESVLKKLINSKPASPIKATDNPMSTTSEVSASASKIVKEEPEKPPEPKQPIKLTIKIPTRGSMLKPIVTSSSVVHIPTPTSVVPVGMFRGVENAPQSTEESILPDDDDDIRIITSPPPPITGISQTRRNSQQMLLTSVTTDSKSSKASTTKPNIVTRSKKAIQPFITLDASNEIIVPNSAFNTIKTAKAREESILSDINNTISLDSDDEDDMPIQPARNTPTYIIPSNQPVPISLTKVAANPNVFLLPANNIANSSKTEHSNKVLVDDLSEKGVDENKQRCKPGDILRITKTGGIEVLKRADTPTAPKTLLQPSDVQESLKKKLVPVKESVPVVAKESTSKSNVNNIQARQTSPFDPLSILKDVIHIEADDYAIQPTANKKASKETLSKTSSAAATNVTSKDTTAKKTVAESNSKDDKEEGGRFLNVLSHKSTKNSNNTNNASKSTTGDKSTSSKTKATPVTPKATPIAPKATTIAPKATTIAPKATTIAPKATTIAPKATTIAPKPTPIAPKPISSTPAASKRVHSTSKGNSYLLNNDFLKSKPSLLKNAPLLSSNLSVSKTYPLPSKSTRSSSKSSPSTSKSTTSTSKSIPSPSKSTPSPSKSTPIPKTTLTGTLDPKKSKIKTTAGTGVIYDSVDLTDLETIVTNNLDNKNRKVIFTSTVVGSSKDIIIGGAGKSLSKRTDSTTTGAISQPAPIVQKIIVSAKAEKRPASSDTTSAKKKKTEQMTLEDFDIDDIDDIIELD